MRQLKKITIIGLLGTIAFLFYSCQEEKFIPDPSDPRLPKYTQSGNQIGGALINNVAWRTDWYTTIDMGWNRAFYFTNYTTGDSITLNLDGSFIEGPNKEVPINFIVVLKNISLDKFADIKQLDGVEFNLDGVENYVIIKDYDWVFNANVDYYYGGIGKLNIKNIKTITNVTSVDSNGEKNHPLIISGTFEFDFTKDNIKIELGRFDFYINTAYLDQR